MKLIFSKEPMTGGLAGMMMTFINGKRKWEFAHEYLAMEDAAKDERSNLYDAVSKLDSTEDRAVFVATIEAMIDAKVGAPKARDNLSAMDRIFYIADGHLNSSDPEMLRNALAQIRAMTEVSR